MSTSSSTTTLQDDPRWVEHRDAIEALRQGDDAHERYRASLPDYIDLLAGQTPAAARLPMMEALIDGEHIPLGVVLAGFRASTAETEHLQDRPPLQPETVDEVARLRAMPYGQYLKTPHWQAVANAARIRAEHRCQGCNRDTGLEVHHRTYERKGEERPADVTVLCAICHSRLHGKPRKRAA